MTSRIGPLARVAGASLRDCGISPLEPDDWQQQALCAQADPETFFPEKGGSNRAAVRVCRQCPVRTECLASTLAWESQQANSRLYGIAGGLSANQRIKLIRRGAA